LILPERTLQYIYNLSLASKLIGRNILDGHGKKALDVGSYKGYGLLALKAVGYEVYGFDINEKAVARARMLGFKNIELHNLEKGIPFNIRFDLITCFDVLEHVRELDAALKALLTADFDVLVITVPNIYTEFLRLSYLAVTRKASPSLTKGKGFLLKDPDHVNMFNPKKWFTLIHNTLHKTGRRDLKIKAKTYSLLCIGSKCATLEIPMLGSGIMIAVEKDSSKDE